MTTDETVEALIDQVSELPAEAQAELMRSLITLKAELLGIDNPDERN